MMRWLVGLFVLGAFVPAQAADVVINQVYAGGGGDGAPWKNDFIELINRGRQPVSLDGWSVQYANTASSTWQVTELGGTLAPGQYYLIQQGHGAGRGSALPPPDAVNTVILNAVLGKVALVSSTAPLESVCPAPEASVDFLGYGLDVACFEGAPAGDLSAGQAAVRRDNGCRDTGKNAADFDVRSAYAPGPRNSGSPFNPPCGGPTATPSDTPTSTPPPTNTPTRTPRQPSPTPTPPPPTPAPARVVINQVYGGSGMPDSPWKNDFIELLNRGTEPVSLDGWSVQYANTASATWQVTELGGTLAPGQYYLIQEGAGGSRGAPLPAPDAASTVLMHPALGKVALLSSLEPIGGLCPPPGSVVDFLGYGLEAACSERSPAGTLSSKHSAVRRDNGCRDTNDNAADFDVLDAYAPGPRNGASPPNPACGGPTATPSDTPTRTPPPTSTRTRTPTLPPPTLTPVPPTPTPALVVILQVYGGGGEAGAPWKNDFVELFNRSSKPVSLDGWSVQYANGASATWQVTELGGTLAPGQHYLVRQGNGGSRGAALPAPDASNTVLMNAGMGKVALASSTAPLGGLCPSPDSRVDFVGYGLGVACSEGAPAANLSVALSLVRKEHGCQDTNDNGADFEIQSAAPAPVSGVRNASMPSTPCP